jgi:beta-glucosidase
VHTWTTFNEPWCSAYLGYGSGAHAPGRTDPSAALAAVHHLNLAHGLAVPEIRRSARNRPDVSITLNLHVIRTPADATPDDRVDEARRRIDALANRAFLSPLLRGRYDDDLLTDTAGVTDWAFLRPGDEQLIQQPIDVLGVNYYSTVTVKMWDGVSPRSHADGHQDAGGSPWPGSDDVEFVVQPGPYTEMGWNIAPDGLEELLVSVHEQFPQQTLMVTENGAAFPDRVVESDAGKRVPDADRVDYLNRHFTAAHRAIQRGVPLHGYFVWSLLDNFEWGWGYSKRFGIVRVDYETQERIPKDSARWLQELIATRATPAVG